MTMIIVGKWRQRLREYQQFGQTVELPEDIDCWPADWKEEFEERAAIMEYDGMLDRPQAEQWAETIVRAAFRVIKHQ